MKKFSIISILVVLTLAFVFCFAGCTNTPDTSNDSSALSNYEVGHKFVVYPTVEFNYKIEDDFIVHISNISVTLVEKNEVKENDTIEDERYSPFTTKMEVSGYTDVKHSGKHISIWVSGTFGFSCKAIISEDGTFYGCTEMALLRTDQPLYFTYISLS